MIRIAIPTTTRADWGLLRPVADALTALGMCPEILVSGTHLVEEFGCTVSEVSVSGHDIAAEIPILSREDSALGETHTMSKALVGFGEYFESNRPDAVLVLGDRYEILAIAEAAFLARIPIFHIHGGEVTQGAIDDAIRHCLTKLSILHFASTEKYRDRIIQLGEHPERVFNVGALGVENALSLPEMSRQEFVDSLDMENLNEFVVMTYHPVTAEKNDPKKEIGIVLDAVESLEGLDIIATKSNADAGGRAINEYLSKRALSDPRLHLFDSLGSVRYMNALRHAKAVVGNSSSGILEAPALGTPTVNIGNRQEGRIKPASVIDCGMGFDDIRSSLLTAISSEFIEEFSGSSNPYGSGDASSRIADILSKAFENGLDLNKSFYDIDLKG